MSVKAISGFRVTELFAVSPSSLDTRSYEKQRVAHLSTFDHALDVLQAAYEEDNELRAGRVIVLAFALLGRGLPPSDHDIVTRRLNYGQHWIGFTTPAETLKRWSRPLDDGTIIGAGYRVKMAIEGGAFAGLIVLRYGEIVAARIDKES